jgi:hypothetical protein
MQNGDRAIILFRFRLDGDISRSITAQHIIKFLWKYIKIWLHILYKISPEVNNYEHGDRAKSLCYIIHI